jgi:hypothetical protein
MNFYDEYGYKKDIARFRRFYAKYQDLWCWYRNERGEVVVY